MINILIFKNVTMSYISHKRIQVLLLFGLGFFFALSCSRKEPLFIEYSNPEIAYEGRIDSSDKQSAALIWSGTSVKINFEGKAIKALLKDEEGNNYYNVIIDNESMNLLRPDTSKKYYTLASGLSKGKHSVEIFKRNEWARGKSYFYGFMLEGNSKLIPKNAEKKRKIEFYGNSITQGYGIEDNTGGDSPDSTFTNNYLSYAAITARHFDAQYRCICKGGIGITISWFPMIMPEMYDLLDPFDSTSKWDFSLYTPDVVVINLFQNDSWLAEYPEHEEFKNRFGTSPPDDRFMVNAYKQFVSSIRGHYPEAEIICILGNMDITSNGSKWPDLVQRSVNELNDGNIYTHFIPYKETGGHPKVDEQEQLAKSLIHFMEENIEW